MLKVYVEKVCLFFIVALGKDSIPFNSVLKGGGAEGFPERKQFQNTFSLLCYEEGGNTILKHVFILEAWIVGYCSMNYCSIITLVLTCS